MHQPASKKVDIEEPPDPSPISIKFEMKRWEKKIHIELYGNQDKLEENISSTLIWTSLGAMQRARVEYKIMSAKDFRQMQQDFLMGYNYQLLLIYLLVDI